MATPPEATIAEALQGAVGTATMSYPSIPGEHYVVMQIAEYRRLGLTSLGQLNFGTTVRLPFPIQGFIDNHQVAFDQRELVNIGNLVGRIPGGQTGLTAAQALLGIAPNNFLMIILNGPTYKQFAFEWTLAPETPQDAANLRRILVNIKNWQAPGLRASGAIFDFPRIFQLGFVPNAGNLFKFKPAVLQNLVVNYAPFGNASFLKKTPQTLNQTSPSAVSIQMTFLELEFWLRGDFNEDHDFTKNQSGPRATNSTIGSIGSAANTALGVIEGAIGGALNFFQ